MFSQICLPGQADIEINPLTVYVEYTRQSERKLFRKMSGISFEENKKRIVIQYIYFRYLAPNVRYSIIFSLGGFLDELLLGGRMSISSHLLCEHMILRQIYNLQAFSRRQYTKLIASWHMM